MWTLQVSVRGWLQQVCSAIDHRDYVTGIANFSRDPNATHIKCFADDSYAGKALLRRTVSITKFTAEQKAKSRLSYKDLFRIPLLG